MLIKTTYNIAWAAATDAGCRHMRDHGRTKWNHDDWNAAVDEFYRLYPEGQDVKD